MRKKEDRIRRIKEVKRVKERGGRSEGGKKHNIGVIEIQTWQKYYMGGGRRWGTAQ